MTSQVAVLNQEGVAIASDTLITQTSDAYSRKTTPNYSKIIELGPQHNVVAMISGNMRLNQIPARRLIQRWSKVAIQDRLNTVEDYAYSFFDWMNASRYHDPRSEVLVAMDRLRWLIDYNVDLLKPEISAKLPRDTKYIYTPKWRVKKAFIKLHDQLLKAELERLKGVYDDSDAFFGCDPEETQNWFWNNEDMLAHATIYARSLQFQDRTFSNLPLSDECLNAFLGLCPSMLARHPYFRSSATIAFVGYGQSDFYPGVVRFETVGIFGGKLHVTGSGLGRLNSEPFRVRTVSEYQHARLEMFAQTNEVIGFVNGANNAALNNLTETLHEKLNELVETWVPTEYLTHFEYSRDGLVEEYTEEIMDAVRNLDESGLTSSMSDSISGMSVMGLAELSSSLVNLQTLAAHKQDTLSTVGGKLEVVTIDPQFGVRWHERLSIPH